MEKAYKYRIYPNKAQKELIQKTFGCTRFVYNHYLDIRMKKYNDSKENFNFYDCCKDLTTLKQELTWLKEVDKCSLQNTLRDLDQAYKNFFKSKFGYPKFKSKKDRKKSYRTSYMSTTNGGNIKFLDKRIQIPKVGKVKIKSKLVPQGRILNATISQEPNGHYYCSLCCTDIDVPKLPSTNKNVGIDLGIVDFAIFSDGTKIENPRFYEKSEKKLTKLQRRLSRKPNDSKNSEKARLKVAKLNRHIANQRNNFLHQLTHNIVNQYDIICIEDLNVKSMGESDSSIRNKHVNDASWSEFRRQLTYKCDWYGKDLRVIDRYYPSSQICNICGTSDGKHDETIRKWKCKCCGNILDRDINAAINILNKGLGS